MTIQFPAPTAPPGSSVPEWAAPFLAVLALIIVGGILVFPLVRAWAKRIEARQPDPSLLDEMAHMRERLADLELSNVRLGEIEERLDFAERLLANRPDRAELPEHRTPV